MFLMLWLNDERCVFSKVKKKERRKIIKNKKNYFISIPFFFLSFFIYSCAFKKMSKQKNLRIIIIIMFFCIILLFPEFWSNIFCPKILINRTMFVIHSFTEITIEWNRERKKVISSKKEKICLTITILFLNLTPIVLAVVFGLLQKRDFANLK